MSGNKEGAKKGVETKKLKYGNDYYYTLASKGGKASGYRHFRDPQAASKAGQKSGEVRRKKLDTQNELD